MIGTRLAVFLAAGLAPAAGRADPPALSFPVDCTLGQDCHIQQYVDRDPGAGAADFACGPLSYNGHRGTDIRLTDMAAMREGVAVLAAAPGRVRAIRDGEADTGADHATEGRECGNGVLIDHGAGWMTQYCHMKAGSIAVGPGDLVTAGAVLGAIGFSGLTEFPHVHFALREGGEIRDPFDLAGGACGAKAPRQAFDPPLAPVPGGQLKSGFAAAVPAYADLRGGQRNAAEIAGDAPALVLWTLVYGLRRGDRIVLDITGPDGRPFAVTTDTAERDQAEAFRAYGRNRTEAGFLGGVYSGVARLVRDGMVLSEQAVTTTLR